MSALIVSSKPYFPWLIRKRKIYCRRAFLSKCFKNNVVIEESIFGATDYRCCDHQASLLEGQLQKALYDDGRTHFLEKWGGKEYRDYTVGKQVIKEAKEVLLTFRYAEKVAAKYNLNDSVYVLPSRFSLVIYREMMKMGVLPDYILLYPHAKIFLWLYNYTVQAVYFLKSLFFLEKNIFHMLFSKRKFSGRYQSAVHLDNGLFSYQYDSVQKNKVFRLFDKSTTIFVSGGINAEKQGWEEALMSAGYNVLNLNENLSAANAGYFVTNIYPDLSIWRFKILLLIIFYPWAASSCYRAIKYRALWESFYVNFEVANSVILMIGENLTSSIVHQKNKVDTYFLYLSTTESIVDKSNDPDISSCHDYTHMISDFVVSSKISNDWIKTHQNSVRQYCDIGPIFSDIVYEVKLNRKSIKDKLQLTEDSFIVSFLDHTVGNYGVLTEEAYVDFLQGMLTLAKDNEDVLFLFKSKKSYNQIVTGCGDEILDAFSKLPAYNNCVYVNDSSTGLSSLDSLTLIGISDLVVSAPVSSVIFESLSGCVRTIAYDPHSQYAHLDLVSSSYMYATDYEKLKELFEYWLSSSDEVLFEYIDTVLNKKTNIDYHAGKIGKFKQLLAQSC